MMVKKEPGKSYVRHGAMMSDEEIINFTMFSLELAQMKS